jgi:hypothetical protein
MVRSDQSLIFLGKAKRLRKLPILYAINQALEAIAAGKDRILLTLATGGVPPENCTIFSESII